MGREMNRDLKEKGKKYRRFPIFQTDSTSNNLRRKYKTRRRRDGKLNKGGEEGEVTRKEINVSTWKSAGDGRITLEMEIRFEYFMKIFPDILS